jgi:hypothetical protein
MTRRYVCCATLGLALCACGAVEPSTDEASTVEQPVMRKQGMTLQGMTLQGMTLQGMTMQGFRITGATLSGAPLTQVRVERGEVIAQRGSTTLRGNALFDAHFLAEARDIKVTPPVHAVIEFKVTAIMPESEKWDQKHTGHTFLYSLEQLDADTGEWQQACPADEDGRRVAIPLSAIWDEHGDRIESSSLFTFGCTTGVIAKCYRWGYRPWVTGYGDLVPVHQTCTRVARADYCGVGDTSTHENTPINLWDNLPSPGPIQTHGGILGLPPLGYIFEAGWNTGGAVCLSKSRWLLTDTRLLVDICPDRLIPPGLLGETVCNTVAQVLGFGPDARMFDEARILNL